MKLLDLGCGDNKRHPGAVGVDVRVYDDVDVVTDLETGLPFGDGEADGVLAYSILEHVEDLAGLMAELHRVCRDGATVEGKVPHWTDRNAYVDPTHVRYFDERTFEFWDPTTELGERGYFDAEFRVREASRVRRLQFWRSRPIGFELEVVK